MTINSTREHLMKYADAVKRLPGVVSADIQRTPNTWEWEMDIHTASPDQAKYIDTMIADRVEGAWVSVGADKPPGFKPAKTGFVDRRQNPVVESNFESVMKKYGDALRNLPGVVGVASASIPTGPLTPAFKRALMVLVDSKESSRFIDNLLENRIEGVDLVVREEKMPLEKYGPEIGMEPLTRTKQNEIRSMLNQYPAGIMMREDGNLFPVRSCSKDMKNNCQLSALLHPRDKFRVFFTEQHTAQVNNTWRVAKSFDGMKSLGKEEYPGDFPGGPLMVGFTFQVEKPSLHLAMPITFEKVAKGWCGTDPGTVVGTTTISIRMAEGLNPNLAN